MVTYASQYHGARSFRCERGSASAGAWIPGGGLRVTRDHADNLPYLSNTGSNSVSVFDVATRKELTRVVVGKETKRLIAVDLP